MRAGCGASVRSGTDLFGGEFASCDLRGVSFEGKLLERAVFDGADLTAATVSGTKAGYASFAAADAPTLKGVRAMLVGANFKGRTPARREGAVLPQPRAPAVFTSTAVG